MTLFQTEDSPTKGKLLSCCGMKKRYYHKRYLQKRYFCFWILAGIFPFMLLRTMSIFSLSSMPWMSKAQPVAPEVQFGLDEVASLERQGHHYIRSGKTVPTASEVPLNGVRRDVRTTQSNDSGDDRRRVQIGPEKVGETSVDIAAVVDSEGIETGEETEVAEILLGTSSEAKDAEKAITDPKLTNQEFVDEKAAKEEEEEEEDVADRHLTSNARVTEGNKHGSGSHAEANAIVEQMEIMEVTESKEKLSQQRRDEREHKDKRENEREQAEEYIQQLDRDSQDKKLHQDGVAGNEAASSDPELRKAGSEDECDLFSGEWVPEPGAPLYTNATCFYIQGGQNCMSNGRHDTGYLHWRWKPWGCDLPPFDPKAFLMAFQGKSIGFVGDSLSRNQMQSLLCMLSQVQVPKNVHQAADDKTVRWLYEDYQVTLGAVWSPYLLVESDKGIMGYEKGRSVLFLDELDSAWTSVMHEFDIIVLSLGQWYVKSSVYIKQKQVVGCHNYHDLNLTDMDYRPVYGEAVRQVIEKVASDFKGIAIMSTFAMSHFEGGSWDNGGQCRRQVPLTKEEGDNFSGYHTEMHDIFMEEYRKVINDKSKIAADTRLELLDVTKVALLRADGHPGPYNHPNPFEGRNSSEWVPNDCLHWCLPGPVDTWNQILVKLAHKHM